MGPYSKDDCSHGIIEPSRTDSLLVRFRSTSLIGQDKAGANPHSRCAEHQGRSHRLSAEQTTRSNDLHRLAGEGALVTLHQLSHGRNEDCCRDIAGVTTTFATLSADNINANVQAFLDVLRMTDHVHVQHARLVKFFHHCLGRNANGRDEKLRSALDNDVDQLVELALGVVVARNGSSN